jgi:hypothetical protein
MQFSSVDIEACFSYNNLVSRGFLAERLNEMSVQEQIVDGICDTLRELPEDQLDQVLRFLLDLEQARKPGNSSADEPVAPLYRAHTAAVRTGIPDLAHQHDHYLYGLDKRDA